MDVILGQKGQMTQVFDRAGHRLPVVVVKSGPNVVTQVKSADNDGYWAVQLGFGERKLKRITKPMQGHFRGAIKEDKAPRFLREVRTSDKPEYQVGDVVKPSDVLKPGDLVSVTGVSKGKGFAGVVARWGFAGGPKTHGQSDRHRAPGSIGQGTDPGRVHKGKKMPGRMGGLSATVKNLTVVSVSDETGEVYLSGPVPGHLGTPVLLRKTGENKKFEGLPKEGEEVVEEVEVREIPEQEEGKEEPSAGGQEAAGEGQQSSQEETKQQEEGKEKEDAGK